MVKVLFDHNMPPRIARSLHKLIEADGHEAFALRDKFPITITDVEIYSRLSSEGDWIAISKDISNAKRRPEREAIIKSGVVAYYFSPAVAKQKVNEQAATVLWQWDKILKHRSMTANGLFLLPVGKGSKFSSL
ncbi:hypothetical protein [Celeribacter baekdonensis]|uniref:PIN-like domain-containing protein n=1 Tax=Celeribacter baekdonensis TaxID=875171 RepID=UPI003A909074